MEHEPMVSVVVTSFNAKQFLGPAVESVLAQAYQDWELLLVDDGSVDGSAVLAQDYAQRNPGRVRYLEHPGHANLGASATRNRGAAAACGRYLAFLDGDDVWLPNKLAEQVALLEAHPEVVMAYGRARWWYGWTGDPRDAARDYLQPLGVSPGALVKPTELLMLFLRDEKVVPSMSGPLFRREVYEQVGGAEESCRSIYDDQTVYAKVGLAGPVAVSGACWYLYRQHPSQRNITPLSRIGRHLAIRRDYINWLQIYVACVGVHDSTLQRAIEMEWKSYTSRLWYGVEYARHVKGWAKRSCMVRLRGLWPAHSDSAVQGSQG
jgi:glycosyltransferase involved in cell wall biosynthesis